MRNIADTVVGDSHTLSVSGLGAPSFTISSVNFVGIDATGGGGQFEFTLECSANIDGAGVTAKCLDSEFVDIRYKLVEDIYGGTPMTMAQAQALFPTDEVSIDTGSAEVLAIGAGGTVNGGFVTKSGASALNWSRCNA